MIHEDAAGIGSFDCRKRRADMKLALRTLAAAAVWTLAANVCLGAEASSIDEKAPKAIGHDQQGEVKASSDAKAATAASKAAAATASPTTPDRNSDAVDHRNTATKEADGDTPRVSENPKSAAPHSVHSATGASNSEISAPMAPVHPTLHSSAGVIDKKTAKAIGLLRPPAAKTNAAALSLKNRVNAATPLSQSSRATPSGSIGSAAATPRTAAFASFGVIGPTSRGISASPVTHGETTAKAITPPAPGARPTNLAAMHDAVINGTNVRHSTSTLTGIGGAANVKTAAVINGNAIHIKPH
jgi:hypothetical protein